MSIKYTITVEIFNAVPPKSPNVKNLVPRVALGTANQTF